MSRRRATTGTFGIISGFFILAALLAGILLVGTANSAPAAAAGPCAAHLPAVSRSVARGSPGPPTSFRTAATPTPSQATSPAPSQPATPTPTPSPTRTTSPSPRPSTTSPAPKAHLCLIVQALAGSVRAGGHARYAIWVWLAGRAKGTAKIKITAKPATPAPSFTVCAAPGRNTCSTALTSKPTQLRAEVAVPRKAVGTHITLRATGTSPEAAASAASSASVLVKANPAPSATPAGVGASPPTGSLPPGVFSRAGLPLLPSPVDDPSLAF